MALTATEEALVRDLIAQEDELLSLAANEPTIISKLGATKVTLSDLATAAGLSDADLFLLRQGTDDKSITAALIKAYVTAQLAGQFVDVAGDTMTGTLILQNGLNVQGGEPRIVPNLLCDNWIIAGGNIHSTNGSIPTFAAYNTNAAAGNGSSFQGIDKINNIERLSFVWQSHLINGSEAGHSSDVYLSTAQGGRGLERRLHFTDPQRIAINHALPAATLHLYKSSVIDAGQWAFILTTDSSERVKINQEGQIYSVFTTISPISSDASLKKNVVEFPEALSKLLQLRPCQFEFIDDAQSVQHDGFIAQEVGAVFPEALREGSVEGTLTYAKEWTPFLVKAIQELSEKLDAAMDRIAVLEGTGATKTARKTK